MLACCPARPARRAIGLLLALLCCLTLAFGCGHSHHSHEGFVMVDNRSDTTTNEFLLAFRLAPFGHPFTGNLLPADLAPAATANLGAHNKDQVRKNVEMVRRFEPLSPDEQAQATELGKKLAAEWGPHFGPVA